MSRVLPDTLLRRFDGLRCVSRSPDRDPVLSTLAAVCVAMMLAACASKPPSVATSSPPSPRAGGYYSDDGPGQNPPDNLDSVPDATPRWEPLHRFANRPYTVLGRDYVPATQLRPYKERGIASWYGKKFHNGRTSIGEKYDMYAMTAAHPTLPLPSYVRVTNLGNRRSVVLRVNDRGPFLHGRIIDVSYAAAHKLGFVLQGSARVEVESVLPEGGGLMATRPPPAAAASGAAAEAAAATAAAAALPPLAAVGPASQPAGRDLPLRFEGGGVFLQLAAFTSLDNAENFLAVMEFQLAGNSNTGSESRHTPRVRSRDNQFRVELGPYASREDAQRAAQELESRFEVVTSARQR